MTNKRENHTLRLKRLGIDSRNEHLIFLRNDCPVTIAEGFEALNRIRVSTGNRQLVASLIVMVEATHLENNEIGLSDAAIASLQAEEGDLITLRHLSPLDSMSDVRAKIYGHRLDKTAYQRIVYDIVNLNLSNLQLAAFLTACVGDRMGIDEVVFFTQAMVETGFKLDWKQDKVYDKHCIGGLPGNRTTPIVVSIAAAAGLTIPKTSSRAITSPAGTADMMEMLTNVNLSVRQMKKVVLNNGGCLAWGGSMQLSPADDILIRVERALDTDSEGQLIASVLSKKAAAGSNHVVIDIPVGDTAKIRTRKTARQLAEKLKIVGKSIGLKVESLITDGSQPVGRGIGPALEAKDVLAVLGNHPGAPLDLAARAVQLAGKLLEMADKSPEGSGTKMAEEILASGLAWEKFERICRAQGGLKTPPTAAYQFQVKSERSGTVAFMDNRKIAKVAKLAGAPTDPAAGLLLHTSLGQTLVSGQPIFDIHAESEGGLSYSLEYLAANKDIIKLK